MSEKVLFWLYLPGLFVALGDLVFRSYLRQWSVVVEDVLFLSWVVMAIARNAQKAWPQ